MNWYRKAQIYEPHPDTSEVDDDTWYDFHEGAFETIDEVLSEFMESQPNTIQPWDYIPFERLKKIWQDYMKFGFVRDEKGVDLIAGIMIKDVQKLAANTLLSGHTPSDPEEYFERYGLTEEDKERFLWDYTVTESGADRISDYALEPLAKDAVLLMSAQTAEEKLQIIDRMLNRIHARGDLAEMFIQGGKDKLNELFGGKPTYASNWYKMVKR